MTKTIVITIDDAKRLPDMLGRIAPLMLRAHGVYRCLVGDEHRTYVLAPNAITRQRLRKATLAVGR